MSCKVGTLDVTATGNASVSGLGFQPNLLIVWGNLQTANGAGDHIANYYGAADGTNEGCVAVYSTDNVSNTVSGSRYDTNQIIHLLDEAGNNDLGATLSSFDSGGFTINVSTITGNKRINYAAIKMDDVAVLTGLTEKNTTGTKAYTGVGFQPDGIILASTKAGTSDSNETQSYFSVGAAAGTGAADEFCISTFDEHNVATSNAARYHGTSSVYAFHNSASIFIEANLDSFDSDGFTLNWTNAASSSGFLTIAVKGDFDVLSDFETYTTTGDQSHTGAGFAPECVFILSHNTGTANSVEASAELAFGAGSGTNVNVVSGYQSHDNNNPSKTDQSLDDAEIYQNISSAQAVLAEWNLKSLDADGFTVTVADGDSLPRRAAWFVMSQSGADASSLAALSSQQAISSALATSSALKTSSLLHASSLQHTSSLLAISSAQKTSSLLRASSLPFISSQQAISSAQATSSALKTSSLLHASSLPFISSQQAISSALATSSALKTSSLQHTSSLQTLSSLAHASSQAALGGIWMRNRPKRWNNRKFPRLLHR